MGLADDATLAYTRLTFAVRGTPLDAARRRLDELLVLALTALDRWTERGRSEEQHGRHLAEHAAVSVVDELLDYMARHPEVRHLIAQQGTSMADAAVGEVRERTASADQWIERLAHTLLHRPAADARAKPADGRGALPPPETAPETVPETAPETVPETVPASQPPPMPTASPRAVGAQVRQARTRSPMGDAQLTHASDPERARS